MRIATVGHLDRRGVHTEEKVWHPENANEALEESSPMHLDLIWIDCPYPVAAIGLSRILEAKARIHVGHELPEGEHPSTVIFGTGGVEGLLEGVKRLRKASPDAIILVFSMYLDLAVARASLRAGARGFIHAGMTSEQIVRAVEVSAKGEIVAPRQLLEYLIANSDDDTGLKILSSRQREILDLVGNGLTNHQVAKRLFLTEYTVKQHLRAAFKVLGVSNRTEATRLLHQSLGEEG